MNMVIGSKVKELRHGAGWATHVNTGVSRKDGTLPGSQRVTASSVIPQHCACSIL